MKRGYQLCLKIVVRCPNGKELPGGALYRPGLSKDDAIRYARRIMTTIPNYEPSLCPHGMPLTENTCGPCSGGRPNQSEPSTQCSSCGLNHGACMC
jgi:hypothetical protein